MYKETIIAPGSAREALMKEILRDQDLLFGKEVLSLDAYKTSLVYKELNEEEEKACLFLAIQDHIRKDNVYYDQLRFPAFFACFYDFANLLVRYGLSAADLPDDEADKKEILSYLLEQDLISKDLKQAFEETKDCADLSIKDCFYPDLLDRQDLDLLIKNGAKVYDPLKKNDTVFCSRSATNNVKEITGVAQYLLKKKKEKDFDLNDYLLMVNDEDNYLPLVRRIFSYYRIPYVLSLRKNSVEARRFLAFLKLIRQPDIDAFVSAYHQNVFYRSDYILSDYIADFGLSYEQLLEPFSRAEALLKDEEKKEFVRSTFGERKIRDLAHTEEICEKIMSGIRKIIASDKFIALKDKTIKEQCTYAYNFLYGNISAEIPAEKYREIRAVRETCLAIVSQEGDEEKIFGLLAYELKRQRSDTRIKAEENGEAILVSDPYQNVSGRRKAIILGCTQQFYPRSIAINGFFDETYIQKIKGFPSLLERSDYFEREYDRYLHQFEEVIFSYPAASVSGSQFERSITISDYVPKDQKGRIREEVWSCEYGSDGNREKKSEKIRKKTAEKIYLNKDGELSASPTSLSKYIGCPFQYFIERGLGIEDEDPLAIGADTIGNIQHNLLERYFKDEIDLQEKNLEEELEPYFAVMKEVMPNDAAAIEAMKIRLGKGFARSVRFLNRFRKADDFTYHTEEKIDCHTEFYGQKFHMNRGSIDRLDTKKDHYRIIDYKSSEKEVSKDDVRKGINFQLLAYLVFYYLQNKEEKNVEYISDLFAYFSTRNKTLDGRYGAKDEDIREEEVKYTTYLTGDDVTVNDEFFNADKNIFDRDELVETTKKLYKAIADRILSGDIAIEPANGACRFCKLNDICHHDKSDFLAKGDMPELV